ncbi:hypothetical protein KAX22_05280 [bacterium]|nr:hypothetical protein [bacterium]
MTSLPFTKTEGINFTVVHTGKWADLDKQAFDHPGLPEPFSGKLFLKDLLKLTGMEVSVNKFPAGAQMPFRHRHKENEELYIFIKGHGQFEVDIKNRDSRFGKLKRSGTPPRPPILMSL